MPVTSVLGRNNSCLMKFSRCEILLGNGELRRKRRDNSIKGKLILIKKLEQRYFKLHTNRRTIN